MIDNLIGHLFQNDELTEHQFFGERGPGLMSAENKLQLAVLEDVVNVLTEHKTEPPWRVRQYYETVWWVNHRGTDWPFSLDYCCECLNLDSSLIRKGLIALILRDKAKVDIARKLAV